MNPAPPSLTQAPASAEQGASVWALAGDWTAAQLAQADVWRALAGQLDAAKGDAGAWSLVGVGKLDHLGAQLLWQHWQRKWPARVELSPRQRAVLEQVEKFTAPDSPQAAFDALSPLRVIGERTLGMFEHLKGLLSLIGQLLFDVARLVRRPAQGPWRDFSGHLYNIGATALPITALVGFLIGVVLAYLISQQLRQYGADAYIVNILGVSLIRELGPMLAAILVAGRSGSAITAQIGVMRVTEELDAMRVMGISTGFRLVMPRVMALAVVMPLISVWTSVAALAGGMLAAHSAMGISPSYFINALPAAVSIGNLTLATSKSVLFGALIALIACHFGLRVEPNTESLGRGTTASVVTSITVVILVDALFAVLFKNVGMSP